MNDDAREPSCVLCSIKHAGTAFAYMQEFKTGAYPENYAKALGELNLAAAHLVEEFPIVANSVRAFRLELEADPLKTLDWKRLIVTVQELKLKLPTVQVELLDEIATWFKEQKEP
jgi:hypothetical protein